MRRRILLSVACMVLLPAALLATGTQQDETAGTGGAGFNATGFPVVDDPVTITVAARKRPQVTVAYDEMEIIQAWSELTNVNVEWQLYDPPVWNERRNLIVASMDLPDAFYGIWTIPGGEIVNWGTQGILVPLEEYIDDFGTATRELFGEGRPYRPAITAPDGHIYTLSVVNEQYENAINDATFINVAWLENLGLDFPQTLDDFTNVLIAFRDEDANGNGDANDEIPFSFRYPHNWSFPMGSFGISDNWQLTNIDEEGQVFFTPTTRNYRDYIAYMHELYSEDLIDIEAFTHNSQVYQSKYRDGIAGVFVEWQKQGRLGPELIDQYEPLPILDGPSGYGKTVTVWNQVQNSTGAFGITSANEHPEATFRWLDVTYEEEWSLQLNLGPVGKNIEILGNGTVRILPTPAGMSYNDFRHAYAPGAGSAFALTRSAFERLEPTPTVQEKRDLYALYSEWAPDEYWRSGLSSAEETEELATLETDIQDYAREQTVRWITEGGVDSGWDNFQNTLRAMGLERLMEIRQAQYDRVTAR
jgi:putative aldouronate transport system substrate-binding protein